MHCSVLRPLRVFLWMALLAAVTRRAKIYSSGTSMCRADACSAISGELLPYLAPSNAAPTAVRNLRATATFTFVLSQPYNAPGIAFVASKCWVVLSPTGRFPIRLQQGIALSSLLVTVVPLRLAVVSTCVPSERPSWTTDMHCMTVTE